MNLTRANIQATGILAAALTAAALAVANFTGDGENGGTGPYVVTLVGCIALAVVLFGWAIPRTEHPGRAGLIAGVLALLSIALYWSGLPFVLGPAAIVFGLLGRARNDGGIATAAVVVGTLATLGAIAALVGDQLA